MCRITLVKEQRASGSFRPFVKMTLRQREGIIIGKKDMGTKNLMNYPEVFADIGNVNLFSGKVILHPEDQRSLWEPWITDHPIHVIDLAEQDEETRGKYHSDFRHIVDYLACKGDKQKLQEFRQDETRMVEHPEEFLDLLDAFAGTKTYKAVKETLEKQRKEGGPEKMCVLYDMVFGEGRQEGRQEGIQEGRQEGIQEGRQEEAVTNARMLFKNGADFELVATSISILSREELEKIYEEVVGASICQ